MPIEIKIPQMGESVTEGVIARWLKGPGEPVAVDEPVVEVETDKITVEVPSPSAGVLTKQGASEGDVVNVGDVVGEIDPAAQATAPSPTPSASGQPATAPVPAPGGNGRAAGPVAMPAAAAEAARSNVDLGTVPGTGRGGRILKEDVLRAKQAPAPAPTPAAPRSAPAPAPVAAPPPSAAVVGERGGEDRKPMSRLRKRVAERLVQAQHTAAILTTFNEVDMSAVIELRKTYKEAFLKRHGVKLGFMSFFVKAAVEALKATPAVNAEIDGDDVVYKYHYDIGVAVGGGKGLVVPVIRDADHKSFARIEWEIIDFATRAQNNKLTLDELTGGTFTVSNGGVYGSMLSTPILNSPQTGILGMHNIVPRPVAVGGQVEVRPVMYLALSYDHRLIDGREAVGFLVRIKQLIEDPQRLFLEV